jgi:hypothetical protein
MSRNTLNCFTRNTIRDIAWEYEIITRIMARAKKPLLQEKPPLAVHTFTLAPDVVKTLQWLSRGASDFLGWPISNSAIVRALVRQAAQLGPSAEEALFRLVEKELKSGVKWGKQT